jgi:UDP-GlcNAc:undecaprenyl-phosphate/decaprenyl-phosphate GlcNAc-1-phosphate transferase
VEVLYIIFFFGLFIFSGLINFLLLRFARTLGIRNKNEVIRWSKTAKPSLGGISFYICFLLSLIAVSFILQGTNLFLNIQILGIVFASTVGFMLGLFDDAFNTKPFVKLFSQFLAAFILISSGLYIHFFDNMMLNYIITLIWIVGIMNSINMLDNIDAVSTLASLGVFLTVLSFIFFNGHWESVDFIIILGTTAALFAFLIFNWFPSKMFMGDTGSQFLGVLLAAYGIKYILNFDFGYESFSQYKNLLSLGLAFILPISDTITVFYKRITKGKSPFIGGKDHTTHHLSYLGLKDNTVAWIFTAIILISIFLNNYLMLFSTNQSLTLFIIILVFIFTVFISLFIIANKNKNKEI